jgi:hypothetical protein
MANLPSTTNQQPLFHEEIHMSKLLSTFLAGAAALALSGTVIAADQQSRDKQTEAQPNATNATPGKPGQRDADRVQSPSGSTTNANATPGKPGQRDADRVQSPNGSTTTEQSQNQSGGEMSAKEKEYLADLKKCDSMSSEKKRTCVDMAKKKHGQI